MGVSILEDSPYIILCTDSKFINSNSMHLCLIKVISKP